MAARRTPRGSDKPRRPPAKTPQAREQQMIALAVDEAERQMLEHSAPAMIITHYLKLATEKEKLERQKIENENLLLQARVKNLGTGEDIARLYEDAMKAFKSYHGEDPEDEFYEG